MERKPLHLVALAAAAATALALAGCSSSPGTSPSGSAGNEKPFEGKTLTLATDPNYPPCQYFEDGSDVMIGFEVDIWDAVAKVLGAKIEIESTQFASLIPGVQSGRYDLAMECITDSAERQKQVTFVNSIYDKTVAVTTESYTGPIKPGDDESLCGQTMSAQTGFDTIDKINDIINPLCKDAGLPEVKIQEYPTAADALNALYSKRADFMILGIATAAYMSANAPEKLVYNEVSSFPMKYQGAVFAIENTALQDAWLAGMKEIIADGSYEKILDKWGMSDLALLDAGINLATERPID